MKHAKAESPKATPVKQGEGKRKMLIKEAMVQQTPNR